MTARVFHLPPPAPLPAQVLVDAIASQPFFAEDDMVTVSMPRRMYCELLRAAHPGSDQ